MSNSPTLPSRDITVILPAYNESASIANAIRDTSNYFRQRQFSYEIIVAADGNDGTREIAFNLSSADPSLKVIGHTQRCGKGRGIREAVEISCGKIVGYTDADNKVDIREFEKLEPFLAEGYEVVFGSRAFQQSTIERQQPWYRRVGSRGFGLLMHAAVGLRDIKDTQCGFKFFQRDAAFRIFREQTIDGYMFDVEILCIAMGRCYRVKEVPIRWSDDGDSRLDLIAGNFRNLIDIFKIRRRSREHQHDVLAMTRNHSAIDDLAPLPPPLTGQDIDRGSD